MVVEMHEAHDRKSPRVRAEQAQAAIVAWSDSLEQDWAAKTRTQGQPATLQQGEQRFREPTTHVKVAEADGASRVALSGLHGKDLAQVLRAARRRGFRPPCEGPDRSSNVNIRSGTSGDQACSLAHELVSDESVRFHVVLPPPPTRCRTTVEKSTRARS